MDLKRLKYNEKKISKNKNFDRQKGSISFEPYGSSQVVKFTMRKAQDRPEGLLSRIQHLADLAGSVSALAEQTGQSRRALTDWLTEVRPPSTQGLRRIVDSLGVDPAWLLDGIGPAPTALRRPAEPLPGVTLTAIDEPQIRSILAVDGAWLHWRLGLRPEDTILAHQADDAMVPEIGVGEPVLCRATSALPRQESTQTMLIRVEGEIQIRLVRLEDKRLTIFGRNKQLEPITVAPKEIEILGEVVWFGRSTNPLLIARHRGFRPEKGPYR